MIASRQAERLNSVFRGQRADATPVLGGWIACPQHICAITKHTLDEYWRNPRDITAKAYQELGTDGVIDLFVPKSQDDFRFVDSDTYTKSSNGLSLEETEARIEALPEPEKLEDEFDAAGEYRKLISSIEEQQVLCGDMLNMPAQWGAGAKINWYEEYGYENFFMILALREDLARKLVEIGGVMGRNRSLLIARAVREGRYPGAVLLGEDICTQRGPMVSPEFLDKYYAPVLRRGLEPLLEAGCRPVWHCDGDVRPIMDMLIDSGVQGLQGFQPECGLTLDYISQLRTRDRKKLLIFGPISVTTELPVLDRTGIRRRVREAIEAFRHTADLVLFTSNTINPDVPLDNILAMYEEATA